MPSETSANPPKWVWLSTRESINNDIPSVTAVLETILAIPLYWLIAIYFSKAAWLLMATITVVPLLLLRSNESAALGRRYFLMWVDKIWNDDRDYKDFPAWKQHLIWGSGVVGIFMGGVLSYILSQHFLSGIEGWSALWRAVLIAYASGAVAGGVVGATVGTVAIGGTVAVAGAIVGTVAIGGAGAIVIAIAIVASAVAGGTRTIFMFPVTLGLGMGMFVIVMAIQIVTTLDYINSGIRAFPRNFRRIIFCTSPIQIPEILPSLEGEKTIFVFPGFLESFRHRYQLDQSFFYLMSLSFFVTFFVTNWFYRLTLKSTAWFWGPLAYLSNISSLVHEPGLWQRTVRWRWSWLIAIMFSIIIAGLIIMNQLYIRNNYFQNKFIINIIALPVFIWTHFFNIIIYLTIIIFVIGIVYWLISYLNCPPSLALEPRRFRSRVIESWWARTGIIMTFFTIIGFVLSNLVLTGEIFHQNPLLINVGYLFLIKWSAIRWQILLLSTTILNMVIVYCLDFTCRDHDFVSDNPSLKNRIQARFIWIERLTRLHSVLTVFFWLMVVTHALLYFNSQKCWLNPLPANIYTYAAWIYGERLPSACHREVPIADVP